MRKGASIRPVVPVVPALGEKRANRLRSGSTSCLACSQLPVSRAATFRLEYSHLHRAKPLLARHAQEIHWMGDGSPRQVLYSKAARSGWTGERLLISL